MTDHCEQEDQHKAQGNQETLNRIGQVIVAAIRAPGQMMRTGLRAVEQVTSPAIRTIDHVAGTARQIAQVAQQAANPVMRHLRALANAAAATGQAGAVVANAVTTAALTTSPVVILAVLAKADISTVDDVTAAASSLSFDAAMKLAEAIESVTESGLTDASAIYDAIATQLGQVEPSAAPVELSPAQEQMARDLAHNEAPVITGISVSEIAENSGDVTVVVTALDPEDGTITKEYVITSQDYEASQEVPLAASITDSGNVQGDGQLTAQQHFTIHVTNVNEAPVLSEPGVSFDGRTLIISTSVNDPDGEVIAGPSYTYTVQQLAAGVAKFDVDVVDAGGLHSNSVEIDPPKLAAQSASVHPVPPTILGIDITQLAENQSAVAHVTAYDAIDGVLTQSITIPAQDYEALSTKAIVLHADIANSGGLHTQADFTVAITDVNENRNPVITNATITQPGPGSYVVTVDAFDPDGNALTIRVGNAFFDMPGGHFTSPVPPPPLHVTVSDGHGGVAEVDLN